MPVPRVPTVLVFALLRASVSLWFIGRPTSATRDGREEGDLVAVGERVVGLRHRLVDRAQHRALGRKRLGPDTAAPAQPATQPTGVGDAGRERDGFLGQTQLLAQAGEVADADHASSSLKGMKSTASPRRSTRPSGTIARPLAQATELSTPDERLG